MDFAEGLRLREDKRERPGDCFWRPKTSDDLTDYIVAIVIRCGIKRTPNAMKLDRRPSNNKTTPHDNSHPIPRTFSGTYKIIFRRCHGGVQVCLGSEQTMEGMGWPGRMQVLET